MASAIPVLPTSANGRLIRRRYVYVVDSAMEVTDRRRPMTGPSGATKTQRKMASELSQAERSAEHVATPRRRLWSSHNPIRFR